ncbi:MAG TPA: hypothetical protein VIV12_08330, partial [Streptosporangiaceae bacterium]
GTCSSPPAGATTYSFDNAGNLASTSNGLSARYNLQNQNSQLTRPGGQPFDMSYVDATSDRRTQAGDLRMSYDLLGLNTQGANSGVPHSDWFVRDPSGTLVARRDSNSNNSNTRDLFYLFDRQGSGHRHHRLQRGRRPPVHVHALRPGNRRRPRRRQPLALCLRLLRHHHRHDQIRHPLLPAQPHELDPNRPVAGNPANPMTLNLYAYTACNPINFTDPTGRGCVSATLEATAGVLGFAGAILRKTPRDSTSLRVLRKSHTQPARRNADAR